MQLYARLINSESEATSRSLTIVLKLKMFFRYWLLATVCRLYSGTSNFFHNLAYKGLLCVLWRLAEGLWVVITIYLEAIFSVNTLEIVSWVISMKKKCERDANERRTRKGRRASKINVSSDIIFLRACCLTRAVFGNLISKEWEERNSNVLRRQWVEL